MATALKAALEDLLRARRLLAEAPPLRGEDRRARLLPTGIAGLDALLGGGFQRGAVSEVHGSVSCGKTGLALALAGHTTARGALAAWVDPSDRLDPASLAASGGDLTRLLWLRGRALPECLSATGTLVGSGLFDVVVLDIAGAPAAELRRLPGTSWVRLQRLVADTPTALVLLASFHTAASAGGATLALEAASPRWSGSGPGRLLRGLHGATLLGRHALRRAAFELPVSP